MCNNIKIVACLLGLASGSAFATQENSINGLDASQRALLADIVTSRVHDVIAGSSIAAERYLTQILTSQAEMYCQQNNIDFRSFELSYVHEVISRFRNRFLAGCRGWANIVERAILHPEEFVQEIIKEDDEASKEHALRVAMSPKEAKVQQELIARFKAIKSK